MGLLAFTCASGVAAAGTHGSPRGDFLSCCDKLIFGKFTTVHRVRSVLVCSTASAFLTVFNKQVGSACTWAILRLLMQKHTSSLQSACVAFGYCIMYNVETKKKITARQNINKDQRNCGEPCGKSQSILEL